MGGCGDGGLGGRRWAPNAVRAEGRPESGDSRAPPRGEGALPAGLVLGIGWRRPPSWIVLDRWEAWRRGQRYEGASGHPDFEAGRRRAEGQYWAPE
ncbi:hypothetical protein NDU88_005179 [Pleurodeles waltl]|uniref:Uncharacterized protein n=1 Tax=Pleurodeles waltl TaxID=8319 RepID=A0AAV7T9U7_PLEWA|nr:hypothetical protein NDU88_005179 [Pleurodeles waltl]